MHVEELPIAGVYTFTPVIHTDERGHFFEWFQGPEFGTEVGHEFKLVQANLSQSVKGTLRGIHLAIPKFGQKKYVMCTQGQVLDYVIDLRPDSTTYMQSTSVELSQQNSKAVFVPNGVGHAFVAFEDSQVVYLCDSRYNPERELNVNPFDPELNVSWPKNLEFKLSPKDIEGSMFSEIKSLLTN